jgi:hypothetical protein
MMKNLLLKLSVLMAILSPMALQPAVVYAACPTEAEANTSKEQVLRGAAQTGSNCEGDQVTSTIRAIVRVLAIIVGAVAVIMIVISGFKYITSGGDSGRIASAKQTLIYALVGLAVAALAQILVNIVIDVAK